MSSVDVIGAGNIEPRSLEDEMRRVSRLLDVGDRRPRAARRARRPQAGAPPHPVRDGQAGELGPRRPTRSRRSRRRRDRQVPPAWRLGDLRHDGRAWRRTSRCATRWSTARATSARSTATRPRPCATPRCAWRALAEALLADLDKETVDFGAQLRRHASRSRWCCRPASRICWSTARRASRWAWRPTSRRTTCAR